MAAPSISLLGATYSGVAGVTLPKSGGGTATFPWVEGSETKTANGTYDVTNLAEVVVNVSGGGGIDCPKFSVTFDPDTGVFSNATCDKTLQECSNYLSNGIGYALFEITILGADTFTYSLTSATAEMSPDGFRYTGDDSGITTFEVTYNTNSVVTVSTQPSCFVSLTATENGTYYPDFGTAYNEVNVSIPSGTSKNTQIVQGTTRTTSSTLTAIGAELTVSKTGTYDVYWSAFRSTTSGSYTYGTRLYVGGTAYGTENTTWSNHVQNNHLTNVSLTENQKIRVYGRNSRGSSYYIYAPTLIIIEK